MSAGEFLTRRYQATYAANTTHPIRVQPETLDLAFGAVNNNVAAGAASNPISAVISRGRRSLGLRPRTVTVKFTGEPPAGYEDSGLITLPWLNTAGFSTLVKGTVGTYLAADIEVVSTTPEQAK